MTNRLFTENQCKDIIKKAEELDNWSHNISNNFSYNIVTFNSDKYISDIITDYCSKYLKLNVLNINMGVIKYKVNDYMGRHYDRNSGTDFNKDFLYNINVRLNDEFSGGEFYLKDKIFESKVGDVYHYKSTEWHEVKPITNGVRYIALFYIRERDIGTNKII